MNIQDETFKFPFEDFLKVLDPEYLENEDSFSTFGLMFECALDEKSRQNLIESPMTEKRFNMVGVSDSVLEKQNTFYVIGAFLKLLKELNFTVEETLDENWDFCGHIMTDKRQLQVSVEFNYGESEVEYEIMFSDERDNTIQNFIKGEDLSWNFENVVGTLSPSHLYEDFETFLRDFRITWGRYRKFLKEKGF